MQTENANFLTKKLVKELAFEFKRRKSLEPYPELVRDWGAIFSNLAFYVSRSKEGVIDEEGFICLAELFFCDFSIAYRDGHLIEGGYKTTRNINEKRAFLDVILDANYYARNTEDKGDEFLYYWEMIFESVDFNGYDIEKILKDVFKNPFDVTLNDRHLLDSDGDEIKELNAMYEMQNRIGG